MGGRYGQDDKNTPGKVDSDVSRRWGVDPRICPSFLVVRNNWLRCCAVNELVVGGGAGNTTLVDEKAMRDNNTTTLLQEWAGEVQVKNKETKNQRCPEIRG